MPCILIAKRMQRKKVITTGMNVLGCNMDQMKCLIVDMALSKMKVKGEGEHEWEG